MAGQRYLTAKEASAQLGISPATLYAYVSRGLIRSEAVEGDTRVRRYHAEDVRKLQERKEGRRNPTGLVKEALHWGAPVLESALTLITEDGLYYRGQDVLELATTRTFEEVAALLWTGSTAPAAALFGDTAPGETDLRLLSGLPTEIDPLQRWIITLTLAGPRDLAAYTLTPEAAIHTGARILRLMAATLVGDPAPGMPIAELLSRCWAPGQPASPALLNAALILSADHELNASSFTARVVASAAVPLYGVVIAGLSALQGFRHGGNALQVEALLREIREPAQITPVLTGRLRRGERIPGFGQKLYPDGDPRARKLLELLRQAAPTAPAVALAEGICAAAEGMIGRWPNVEFALAALAQTLNLPPGASLWLFALGRTAGWIGHALEQYAQGDLIRPRAAYVGPPIAPAPQPPAGSGR